MTESEDIDRIRCPNKELQGQQWGRGVRKEINMLVFKLKCVCRKKQKTKCFLGTLWTHFHPPHLILALSLPSGLGFLLLNFLFSLYVSLHQNTLIATIIFLLPHLHLAPYFPFISSLSLTLLFSLSVMLTRGQQAQSLKVVPVRGLASSCLDC